MQLVGQSSCDSSGVQLVGQSSCGSSEVQLVGQSSCGSSEMQLVGRLPARVVELLQSSTVGKPSQDRRLCQDHVGTPLSSGPTTSSGLGPTLGAQGSLRGSVNESEFLQRSACVHGLVGRSVGRSVVQKGSCSRRSVVQKYSCGRRSVVQKCSCSRLRVPKKKPKLGPYEGMRPFPKWVRPPPAMAVEEVSSGEGDVEMEVPSGSSAARPPEVPKAPQLLSGTGTEGITDAEMMELRIIMDEDWSPPYRSPPAVWSCHGPLEHNQTGYFDFCLLCGKWLSQGHLQSDSHMRQMERWLRADKPALAIPHDRFMDHERLEMLIQARHPLWSSNMVLSAKERVLQMEFFEAQEGVYTGEIPAEFGSGRPEEEAAASAARPALEAAASAARPAPPTSTEEPREKKPRKTEPPPPKSGRNQGSLLRLFSRWRARTKPGAIGEE